MELIVLHGPVLNQLRLLLKFMEGDEFALVLLGFKGKIVKESAISREERLEKLTVCKKPAMTRALNGNFTRVYNNGELDKVESQPCCYSSPLFLKKKVLAAFFASTFGFFFCFTSSSPALV